MKEHRTKRMNCYIGPLIKCHTSLGRISKISTYCEVPYLRGIKSVGQRITLRKLIGGEKMIILITVTYWNMYIVKYKNGQIKNSI